MTPDEHMAEGDRLVANLADMDEAIQDVRTKDDIAAVAMTVAWASARIQGHYAAALAGFTRDAASRATLLELRSRATDGLTGETIR